jgi:hypothetical protein
MSIDNITSLRRRAQCDLARFLNPDLNRGLPFASFRHGDPKQHEGREGDCGEEQKCRVSCPVDDKAGDRVAQRGPKPQAAAAAP